MSQADTQARETKHNPEASPRSEKQRNLWKRFVKRVSNMTFI